MRFDAVALDLDGTLTNSEKKITLRTKNAIFTAIEKGVKIIIASGRPLIGIKKTAEELELYERGGYILACNGGQIIDCKTNKVIFERLIPVRYYKDICECAKKFDVSALTYDETGILTEDSEAEYVKKEAFNNSIPIHKVDNIEKVVGESVVKFMIVGEPGKITAALDHIKQRTAGGVNAFLSESYFIELTAPGVEKSSALEFLTEYLGIKREKLAACGDGLNDISMLSYAGFAVVMNNAYDEVKKYADFITLSNNHDGVAEFFKKFI